jgi:hypothetical protein
MLVLKTNERRMAFSFCFHLELDSDFDSHDGSDNENENSVKYDVRHSNDRINMILSFFF